MSERDYRFEAVERRLTALEEAKPAVIAERVSSATAAIGELRDDVKTMKRAFYAFALSITGSAIIFALTVFKGFG